jgi:arylsulfatase A-like enzyme
LNPKTFALLAGAVLLCGCPLKKWRRASKDAGSTDAAVASAPSSADAAPLAVVDAAPPPLAEVNVLLVSIDSLRWDMPWAGYGRPIAPALTELEKKSVSYTRSYALSSYTSTSLAGFLASKLPGELKRDGFFFNTFHKDNLFFPELLHARGIKTIAAHAHGYFKDAGYNQGFDVWQLVPNIKFDPTTDPNVTSPEHEALAEKLLDDPALESTRFFAWFHFMDPHDAYVSHAPEIPPYGRTRRDLYDGEVTFTDKYVGRLLDYVATKSWAKSTAIIVTADHGEALGEKNQVAHGFELWEHLVRVPLFFVVPGVAPRHVDAARSAIDLAPTICELMGVSPDPGFEGTSLVPELRGAPAAARDIVLDLPISSDNDRRRALIHGDLKIIAYGDDKLFQVYDLADDPEEKHPLMKGPEFGEMKKRYLDLEKTVKDVLPYACLPDVCLNGAYKKPKDAGP